MTPILGTALAIVLADRRNALRSVLMVLTGALLVVVMGFLLGLLAPVPEVAATNEQVAQRVDPHLVDLIAALATGAVGAFALVRSDISDTLPGVAIAISLVPPLAVVGLTLESGAPAQAAGALLLFGTNVASIIAMGTVVLLGYRVRTTAVASGQDVADLSRLSLVAVGAFVLLMAVPLGVSGVQLYRQTTVVAEATPIAQQWAQQQHWQVTDVQFRAGDLWITATGPAPNIDPASLRRDLTAAGLGDVTLEVQLLDGGIQQVHVPGRLRWLRRAVAGGGAHALATRAAHDRGASACALAIRAAMEAADPAFGRRNGGLTVLHRRADHEE